MTVHLIKLAVGVESVDHLAAIQSGRLAEARAEAREPVLRHITRNRPQRADEVVDGGSLYWVIKRVIQVRQQIVDVRSAAKSDGRPACALVLDPDLVRTRRRARRPFQGWRYLRPEDAPPDRDSGVGGADALPLEMAEELRRLGLL
ncbi:MAG: DUF1489 domain-containing protein [Rhodospirillales bacterium]|jgi:hypothetical protein|nr:DUF1489 domain-containing protein [Rhodospirillales bacterium]